MLINVDRVLNEIDGSPILIEPSQQKVLDIKESVDDEFEKLPYETEEARKAASARAFSKARKAARKELTLKDACIEGLMLPAENNTEAIENYALAMRVREGGDIELTSDQIVKIKGLIAKRYSAVEQDENGKKKEMPHTIIVGQALAMLEPK